MTAIRELFATRIYESTLAEDRGWPRLHADLVDACAMVADGDLAGRAWCKANGYGGYTSYASLNDLPRRATAFGDLKRKLDKHAATFAAALEFDLGGGRLALDSLWVSVLKPGAAHSGHIHPHSVLSGTVYVTTPPGAGGLRLEDPRLPLMMAAPPRRSFETLTPAPGTLFLWESWLRHEVLANTAKTPRLSLSFNYAWHS